MKTRNCVSLKVVLINCLLIHILQVTAAPAASVSFAVTMDSGCAGTQKYPTKTKTDLELEENKSETTTPSLPDDKFKYHGEVALYYSGGGNFTVIQIYPYLKVVEMIKNSNSMVKLSSKEIFNLHKTNLLLHENSACVEDPSGGLIRVVKIGNKYTIDLNGVYPEENESRFKVSEYLQNTDGSPDANLLVLESSEYSGQYLRWHDDDDDGNVDCEPIPKDDAHYYYWKFALPTTTQIIPQMLPVQLKTDSNLELVFVNGSPHVTAESTNNTN